MWYGGKKGELCYHENWAKFSSVLHTVDHYRCFPNTYSTTLNYFPANHSGLMPSYFYANVSVIQVGSDTDRAWTEVLCLWASKSGFYKQEWVNQGALEGFCPWRKNEGRMMKLLTGPRSDPLKIKKWGLDEILSCLKPVWFFSGIIYNVSNLFLALPLISFSSHENLNPGTPPVIHLEKNSECSKNHIIH